MPSRLLLAFGRPLAARANVPLSLWATGLGAKPSAAGWNFHPFGYGIRFKSEKKGSDPKSEIPSTSALGASKRSAPAAPTISSPTVSIVCHPAPPGGEDPRSFLKKYFASQQVKGKANFEYDPSKSYISEFHRLAEHFGWTDREGEDFQRARRRLNSAAVRQFNALFGKKQHSIKSWQKLFSTVEGVEEPKTLDDCFRLVQTTHINICDLIDARFTGDKVKNFKTEVDLSRYTIDNKKIFPRDHVLAGDLLYFLLRHILSPSLERGSDPEPLKKK